MAQAVLVQAPVDRAEIVYYLGGRRHLLSNPEGRLDLSQHPLSLVLRSECTGSHEAKVPDLPGGREQPASGAV